MDDRVKRTLQLGQQHAGTDQYSIGHRVVDVNGSDLVVRATDHDDRVLPLVVDGDKCEARRVVLKGSDLPDVDTIGFEP
jgi:hypothetical protein